MGFFKRLASVFGFGQEAVKNEQDDDSGGGIYNSGDGDKPREANHPRFQRKGFGVPVQVAVERSHLLQPCAAGDGGIQVLICFPFWNSFYSVVDCFIMLDYIAVWVTRLVVNFS